jgi:hypothetical protein
MRTETSALRRPARHLRRGAPLQRRTRRSRGADPASPPNRLNPRGVRLTFGAHSTRRIGLSGSRSPCGLSQAPGVFRRAAGLGRLLDLLASLPWPSPLLQGCHSRPPAALRPLGRRATRLSWGFLPFSTCQTRGSTCAGRSELPATFRPRGFDPLAGFLPASPPGPVSCRSAPGLRPSGVPPPGPSAPLTRPVTSTTLAARRLYTSRRKGAHGIGRAPRKPVLEASRPRSPDAPAGCSPVAEVRSPRGLHPP